MLRQVSPHSISVTRMRVTPATSTASRALRCGLRDGGTRGGVARSWTSSHAVPARPRTAPCSRARCLRPTASRRRCAEELVVETDRLLQRGAVHAQQPGLRAAQEAVERGLGAKLSDEHGALRYRQRVGPGDPLLETCDDLSTHRCVTYCALGVVADDEAVAHRLVVDAHLLYPRRLPATAR